MRVILLSVFTLGWGAAMYGVLSIRAWDVSWAHSICGPWGCGPTVPSLIAFHGFWLTLLGGGAVLLAIRAPAVALRTIGAYLALAGLLLLVVIGVWDMWTWLPQTAGSSSRYLWQRYLFSVATETDVPAVQCGIVGLCLFLAGKAKANRSARQSLREMAGH